MPDIGAIAALQVDGQTKGLPPGQGRGRADLKVQAGTAQIRRFLKEGLWSEEPASRWIVARAVSLLPGAPPVGRSQDRSAWSRRCDFRTQMPL